MRHVTSRLGITRAVVVNSARTVVATVVSMLLARLLKLPEFYWLRFPPSSFCFPPLKPLTVAWQRFAGTALGAALGALIAIYFQPTWIVYGAGIFVCGILCALLRIESAYRFRRHHTEHCLAHRPYSIRPGLWPLQPLCGSVAGNRGSAGGNSGVACAAS